MKTKILSIFLLVLAGCSQLIAQGFQPPSPGKAVVYFVRASNYGYKIPFEHFFQDKYIGTLPGKNYLRYECDPGEHLFWANSEIKEFVTADLKANETYVVLTNVVMGAFKARVGFDPIYCTDKRFEVVKEMINSKPPLVTPQKKIDDRNKKLSVFIPEQLKRYNEAKTNGKIFKHISPDMAISADVMK
jgi:hypothetical protein